MNQYPTFLAPVDPDQDDAREADRDPPVEGSVEPAVYANLFSAYPAKGADVVGQEG